MSMAVGRPSVRIGGIGIGARQGQVSAAPSAPAEPTTLLLDNFVGANGTSLDAHAPDTNPGGNAWVEQAGISDIQSNRLNFSGSSPGGAGWIATIDIEEADYEIEAVVRFPTSGSVSIVIRYVANNNFYLVMLHAAAITIYQYNGSFVNRGQVLASFAADTNHTLALSVLGANIAATVNGGNQVAYGSLGNLASTIIGAHAQTASSQVESIEVTDFLA